MLNHVACGLGCAAERPAFSRWRECACGGTPPTGTRVPVGCNGMLGPGPRSFSSKVRNPRGRSGKGRAGETAARIQGREESL